VRIDEEPNEKHREPYPFKEFENFFGQIRKMDFSRKDLKKSVFKEKQKRKDYSHITSSLSHAHHEKKHGHSHQKDHTSKEHNLNWRKHKEDTTYTKLKFRTADMNDPDILKGFLRLNGIPSRPY
jgi:hypothetical protein